MISNTPLRPAMMGLEKSAMPFGGGKPIPECANAEIVSLLVAGSLIGFAMILVSVYSGQPELFAWFLRLFVFVALGSVWYSGIGELRKRRREAHNKGTPPKP